MGIFSLKVDEIYETLITSLENEGSGVAKINGMIVFIPKSLVGEKVRVRIIEVKKNFARAKLIEILESSKNRVESSCPYYNECGGCSLRHQTEKENLSFKTEKVKNAIKRIGKLNINVDNCIPSFKENNYRNKASFKVENNRIGFYAKETYQLVDIKNCMLLEKELNDALEVLRSYIKDNTNEIKNITIKHGNAMDELLIDIYSTDKNDKKILDYLINNIKKLKTVIFNDKVIYGDGYINQISNGLMFNCSSKSFFQVNGMQAEKLYEMAISLAHFDKSDIVLDLYCGTGTITNIIANHVKKVIGIEIVESAIIDARKNSKINNINNTKFILGDVSKKLSKIDVKVDDVILDPPRCGIDRKTIAIIKKILPKKILYISCNPVTLARDLNYLSDLYETKKVVPVDMFPFTSHVECVSVLHQKNLEK